MLEKHQGIIQKICFVYAGRGIEKEDLCQEIILQLWKSYPSFRHESAFSTWMYRVALNTALSLTRKPKLTIRIEDVTDRAVDTVHQMDKSEEIMIMHKAISRLNNIEKAIILLWLEDKTYEEIAETTGLNVKNISVRLVRIRAKLKEMIRKYQ